MQILDRFAAVVHAATEELRKVASQEAAVRATPDAWSKKQELGHLIDSAINNYVRLMRVQAESAPALPNYEADFWVECQGYQDRDWQEIIQLWSSLNRLMLSAAHRVPREAWERTCTIGGGSSITLGFVIEDYVDHMVHHLQHIGMGLSQFRRAESAYA